MDIYESLLTLTELTQNKNRLNENKALNIDADEFKRAVIDYYLESGFSEKEAEEEVFVDIYRTDENDGTVIEVRYEPMDYDWELELTYRLDKVLEKYESGAYFDLDQPGIATAYIWD